MRWWAPRGRRWRFASLVPPVGEQRADQELADRDRRHRYIVVITDGLVEDRAA